MQPWIVALIFAYLVGSIPTGLWIGRRFAGVDVRGEGSGSSGGTNVARILGWRVGLGVVALDVAKGFLAVAGAAWLAGRSGAAGTAGIAAAAGAFAVLGHVLPVWADFRGGKGVAVAGGALLALEPRALAFAAAVFALALLVTRVVSLASVAAAGALAVGATLLRAILGEGGPSRALVGASVAFAALIGLAHRANLRRLAEGREPVLGRSRPAGRGSRSGDGGSVESPPGEP